MNAKELRAIEERAESASMRSYHDITAWRYETDVTALLAHVRELEATVAKCRGLEEAVRRWLDGESVILVKTALAALEEK
jgi:hypothetical protein